MASITNSIENKPSSDIPKFLKIMILFLLVWLIIYHMTTVRN